MLGGSVIVSALRYVFLFFYAILLKQYCTVFKTDFPQTASRDAQHMPNNQVPKFSAA